MQMDKYERWFLYATVAVLVAFFVAVIASVGEAGIHLPTQVDSVDPTEVSSTPPFDNPGLFQTGDDTYDAVIVAQTWQFTPEELTVPAGSEVTFIVTSRDVIHGFMIPDTVVNAMVIPGQITEVTYTFEDPGEHKFICHEYCGLANDQIGHHSMFGRLVVE